MKIVQSCAYPVHETRRRVDTVLDTMIWSFVRDAARIDIEVRRAPEGGGRYELIVDYPDGSEIVEHFRHAKRLVDRSLDVQASLMDQGWRPAQRRGVVLPAGARGRRRRGRIRRMASAVAAAQTRWARRLAASFGF